MATMISGLGGPAGYGENVFSGLVAGNLDDSSINVNITSVFGGAGVNLYGTNYTSLFINSNGLLTFGSAEPNFTPANLTTLGQPSIAPFWADIDIRNGGEIYWDLDPVSGKFIVTWLNVAAFSGPGTNSFQVVLTSLGGGDFGVDFIYNSIGFTNGNNGEATVGVSNGTSSQTLVEGSGNAAFLATYAGNDFDTNDPIGVYSMQFEAGAVFTGDGVVDGTAGNDIIDTSYVGDPDGDRIDANDATGYAGGTGQDDYVLAGAGNDSVTSGLGNDQVYGGAGNDTIVAGNGNDSVYGGTENDSIDGGSGNDLIYGGTGDDTLSGGAASTATAYTISYFEITGANQTVTGTNGRPNFNVSSISGDNDLTNGANGVNGPITGFRLGNGDSIETHTHTASSQVSGGQIIFNAINSTETLTISIDGTVINVTTAAAAGIVTFNGAALYSINGSGQIVRNGGAATSTTTGSLIINVPYSSVSLAVNGATTGAAAGLYYEYYVNTNPPNVAAAVGGNDTLYGGAGNDVITGGTGNDSLFGEDGNDSLDGGDDNDVIVGGFGNDTALGGLGDDSLAGDAGNDTLSGGAGNDSLYGGAEDDLLNGDLGNDLLQGDAGNDTVYGGDGNDLAYGGDGNDTLGGWSTDGGDDTFYGGLGDDLVYGGGNNDQVYGDDGNDTLSGGFGTDSVFGGIGSDTFIVTEDHQNDTITGGENAGDVDLLSFNIYLGTVGVTAVFTANETGTYDYNAAGDAVGSFSQIEAVSGTQFGDTLNASVTTVANQLYGNDGSDALTGGSAGDSLFGGNDNDTLNGGAGADTLQGGSGNDSLVGGSGIDSLFGGDGADQLFGGTEADVLFGENGNDTLSGGDGADALDGGADNDTLTGDAGADTLSGGAGNDSLDGGADADSLTGGDGADTLVGGTGADTLTGGLGADTLQGGDDQDTFYGSSGDLVDGGEGGTDFDILALTNVLNVIYGGGTNESGTVTFNDATTLTFSNIESLIFGGRDGTVNGTAGGDLINAGFVDAQGDTIDGNDALLVGEVGNDDIVQAGAGNDTITAGLGNDDVFGGAGDDSAAGGAGNDSLDGGADNDTLAGDAGNDTLVGGIGNDSLDGGDGNDLAIAGDGNDTVVGGYGNDSILAGAGNDTVVDEIFGGVSGGGADTVDLGDGNDTFTGSGQGPADTDLIYGGLGNDTITVRQSYDTVYGGGGDDSIVSTAEDPSYGDQLYGDSGNDTITGANTNDQLFGGTDNDQLYGGGNTDTLSGGAGDDTLDGGDGNDTLTGEAGTDLLTGGAGNDSVDGGAGNDTLFGDVGADTLLGGDDDDYFDEDLNAIGDVVDGGEGGATDNDVLDLTDWGWSLTNIIYDPMNSENGTVEFLNGAGAVIGTMAFQNIEHIIPCFTPGVMIATDRGDVAVENLRAGDLVMTRDGGLKPVRWVGRRSLGLADLIVRPTLRPVQIAKGALGGGLPVRSTLVSPQHRMLIEGAGPEMLFGETEVLVAAAHLTGLAGVEQLLTPGVTYIHVLMDRHEIICANGSWTESFQPADRTLGTMGHAQREEIAALFPELAVDCDDYQSARLSLKAHEARVLLNA